MSTIWQITLGDNRDAVLTEWLELALGLFSEKMPQSSPTAVALRDAMALILDGFVEESAKRSEGINRLTRIMAIHPAPPSRSLSLFADLERLLRALAPKGTNEAGLRDAVDAATLEAFDRFMEHREVLYRLKVDESRRSMHMLLRRAGS